MILSAITALVDETPSAQATPESQKTDITITTDSGKSFTINTDKIAATPQVSRARKAVTTSGNKINGLLHRNKFNTARKSQDDQEDYEEGEHGNYDDDYATHEDGDYSADGNEDHHEDEHHDNNDEKGEEHDDHESTGESDEEHWEEEGHGDSGEVFEVSEEEEEAAYSTCEHGSDALCEKLNDVDAALQLVDPSKVENGQLVLSEDDANLLFGLLVDFQSVLVVSVNSEHEDAGEGYEEEEGDDYEGEEGEGDDYEGEEEEEGDDYEGEEGEEEAGEGDHYDDEGDHYDDEGEEEDDEERKKRFRKRIIRKAFIKGTHAKIAKAKQLNTARAAHQHIPRIYHRVHRHGKRVVRVLKSRRNKKNLIRIAKRFVNRMHHRRQNKHAHHLLKAI